MFFLADATPDPNAMLQFWIIIGMFAAIAANVVTVIVMLSNRKQRNEVTISPDAASKKDLEEHLRIHREDINDLHRKIGSSERETRRQLNEEVKTINSEIIALSKSVGEVKALNETQTAQLSAIANKLDEVILKNIS